MAWDSADVAHPAWFAFGRARILAALYVRPRCAFRSILERNRFAACVAAYLAISSATATFSWPASAVEASVLERMNNLPEAATMSVEARRQFARQLVMIARMIHPVQAALWSAAVLALSAGALRALRLTGAPSLTFRQSAIVASYALLATTVPWALLAILTRPDGGGSGALQVTQAMTVDWALHGLRAWYQRLHVFPLWTIWLLGAGYAAAAGGKRGPMLLALAAGWIVWQFLKHSWRV